MSIILTPLCCSVNSYVVDIVSFSQTLCMAYGYINLPLVNIKLNKPHITDKHLTTKRRNPRFLVSSGVRRRGEMGIAVELQSVSHEFKFHKKDPVVSLSKKLYPHFLGVPVGSRDVFDHNLH